MPRAILANIFLVCHILLLFALAKYEKLGKYFPYCTWHRTITTTYIVILKKTDIARESVYLRTIDRTLTLNLIVIFNSFTDISFLKYGTKIFFISHYFQCFKVKLSGTVFVNILSSKRANQLQVLYIRTLRNIQRNFFTKATVLKCIPSNFFLKFADVLGQYLKR